jgi:hypothetical protein
MTKELEILIRKIIDGKPMSKEDLQLYVNHSEEIESRLQEIMLIDK